MGGGGGGGGGFIPWPGQLAPGGMGRVLGSKYRGLRSLLLSTENLVNKIKV